MKSILTLVFLFTLINVGYTQQESEEYLNLKGRGNFRQGYIVNKDSEKVKGLIKNNGDFKLSDLVYFVPIDGELTKYTPDDIKGFTYSIYKYISDGNHFYHCQYEGRKMSLYTLTKRAYGYGANVGTTVTFIETYYVKRPDESDFTFVKGKHFKKEFSAYFSDCDKVAQKILNKEYKIKDIRRIVREYNFCQ